MLPKIERLFHRGYRALSKSVGTVTSNNKENLPSVNKEPSPSGNKEHTPKASQVPSSSHPIRKWLKNVINPVDGSPANKFRATHHSPHGPDTMIQSLPSPSLATPVQPQPTVEPTPLDRPSPSLNTLSGTIIQFSEHGRIATSTKETAFFPEDTEPQYLAKQVKLEPQDSVTKRKRSEDTDVNEDDKWDSEPPTSPEYNISIASDGGDSDTSDASSSPHAKRVKRAALHPSVKSGRSIKPKVGKTRRKKKKGTWDSDRSMSEPSDLDESEEEYIIPTGERDELLNNKLTRERAKRLLEAVELPQGHDLSPDEQRTAHQLLTRGCMPTIHRHWEKDFSTLPESLFFSGKDDEGQRNESNFILENDKCSEFYAIRAFQELLKICGNVRDYCNILDICPAIYIKKSIEKYLRWALSDAGVRVQPNTPPVHVIYRKPQDEEPKEAFNRVAKTLEDLSNTWQSQLAGPHDGEEAWPALMGLVLCGPVLSVISLDTNPNPQTLTHGIKFLGHFDLSDFDNDVWNTLAIAIIVMHIRRTVTKLAKAYYHRFVASIFDGPAMNFPDPDR